MRHAALALPLLIASAALAETPHQAWVRSAVASLPVYHEDTAAPGKSEQLDAIADAVARESLTAPRPPREWAALLLTVARHESGLSSRIIANRCKPRECDRGRARGLGQVHRNSLNGADWDAAPGNVAVQVKLTSDALKRSYRLCSRSGADWRAATLSAYAGQRCSARWAGLETRLVTFERLVRVTGGGKS
jgi:hypothetical protein